jgi:hypothetical protein
VTPKGQRYWRFRYRFQGKEKILAFGVYPDVSLADAREKRDAARKVVAAGEDPAATRGGSRRRSVPVRRRPSASLPTNGWIDWRRKVAPPPPLEGSGGYDFARPALGDRPIAEITAPELLEVLRKVEARGRYETANRCEAPSAPSSDTQSQPAAPTAMSPMTCGAR